MKSILVLIATFAFVISPFLSPEFGGFDPNLYPIPQDNPPVQPAGWAFSIWGVIYLGLLIHAIYGVAKHINNPSWQAGRVALFVSLAVGAFWLPVALMSPVWATVMIWVMLISALLALYQMKDAEPRILAQWPVALYAGWLSAASFVSIGLLLAGYGFTGAEMAAIIALILAAPFAAYQAYNLKLWPYGAAVAWGFGAIAIANLGGSNMLVVGAAASALLVILVTLMQLKPTDEGFDSRVFS